MTGRTAQDVVGMALQRGAITEARAVYWLSRAEQGEDVSFLDSLAAPDGRRVTAASWEVTTGPGLGPITAGRGWGMPQPPVPQGSDPLHYAVNPLLDELRRDRPALVAAAMQEDPNPPRLFEDRDLPEFTASGLDPSVLATLPWAIRRPVAAAPTQAAAYEIADKYRGAPEQATADLARAAPNRGYVEAMSLWLRGSGYDNRQPPQGLGVAASGETDYSVEALHQEIFGPTRAGAFDRPAMSSETRLGAGG